MTNSTEYIPQRAMSIHAHPDDQDFSVAATLAKWAQAGCEILSVVITSGDSGSNDPADGSYKPILAELREKEQQAVGRGAIAVPQRQGRQNPQGTFPSLGQPHQFFGLMRRLCGWGRKGGALVQRAD